MSDTTTTKIGAEYVSNQPLCRGVQGVCTPTPAQTAPRERSSTLWKTGITSSVVEVCRGCRGDRKLSRNVRGCACARPQVGSIAKPPCTPCTPPSREFYSPVLSAETPVLRPGSVHPHPCTPPAHPLHTGGRR